MKETQIELPDALLAGEASSSSPDFLLLHAGGERRQVWRPVMEHLSGAGLGCVAYDQRGHGETVGDHRNDIAVFGSDAAHMLAVNGTAKIIVGGSLGGFAAILALANSEIQSNMAGLVLVDVVPAPDPERVRRFLSPLMAKPESALFVESILAKSDLILSAAAKLTLPVLLVRGGLNGAIQDHEVKRLRNLCPQLAVDYVENAGHLVARDAPGDLARHLLQFEQSHDVRQRKNEIRQKGSVRAHS